MIILIHGIQCYDIKISEQNETKKKEQNMTSPRALDYQSHCQLFTMTFSDYM